MDTRGLGLQTRTLLAFSLSLILIFQIFCITQSNSIGTNISDIQNASAQTSNSADNGLTLYTNNKYNFTIQYPQGWNVQENHLGNPADIVGFYNDQVTGVVTRSITIAEYQVDLTQSSLKTLADSYLGRLQNAAPGTNLIDEGSLTINNYDTYFIEFSFSNPGKSGFFDKTFYVAADNGHVDTIDCFTTNMPYDAQLNQCNDVASTFELSNENPSTSTGYSNYSLQQGEWIKYKMHLNVTTSDPVLQQKVEAIMTKMFSSFVGQPQLNSLDDIDWIKSTITNVSTNDITVHAETQVLGNYSDLGNLNLAQSPSSAIPTNAQVGDIFDSPFSTTTNPSKVTLTAIKQENILGNNINVYELTSHQTYTGQTSTTQEDQILFYDTTTGILLDWAVGMKVYSPSGSVNTEFTMVPIEWSQSSVTSQQTASVQATSYTIPSWIKNTAEWWSEGQVTDSDFIQGVQYLIQNGIVVVPTMQVSSQPSQGIPSWVKNNAKWWAAGQLEDADFIKGIQYLVQNGIIVPQNNNQQTTSNPSTLGYSTPSLLNLPTQQTPELAPPELGTSQP